MKAKFISACKKIKAFAKRNAFSCACFLLAVLVFVTGSISYAKYTTGSSSGNNSATAASFSASATIDGVSALSFTNTAFWGNSAGGDRVPMNPLRSVNFSVNNFKQQGEQTIVASVRMKYVLSFSAPANFAQKLALQVFDESNTAMTPQIVVGDFISAADEGKSFDTSQSEDYSSSYHPDVVFSTSKTANSYQASTTDGSMVVRLEKFQKQTEQSLMFRLWDTSSLTSPSMPTIPSEGGQLQTPLSVAYAQMVEYYRITFSLSQFVLPAGVQTTVKHSVQLAPVDSLEDPHVGGTFVDVTRDESNKITGFALIQSIYGGTDDIFTLMRVNEAVTDVYYASEDHSGTPIKTETSSRVLPGTPGQYYAGQGLTTSSNTTRENNVTSGEQPAQTTTTISVGNITWTPTITGTELTKDDPYTNPSTPGYKGVYVRQDNNWGTPFYLYELPATATGEAAVTETRVTTQVLSQSITDTNTEITEHSTVQTVTGAQETITLDVTKTTSITNIGSQTVKTITEERTYTRTFTATGTTRVLYFLESASNSLKHFNDGEIMLPAILGSDGKYIADPDKEGESHQIVVTQNDFTPTTSSFTDPENKGDFVEKSNETKTGQSFVQTTPTTEYISRTLERDYEFTEVVLTDVVWCQLDASGNPVYDEAGNLLTQSFNKTDTTDNTLHFYADEDGTSVQQMYLAQCYSKEYPFFVNVVFEQIQ